MDMLSGRLLVNLQRYFLLTDVHEDISASDSNNETAEVQRTRIWHEVNVGRLPPHRVRRRWVDVHVKRVF